MPRGRAFVTLDFYETGNVIWALDREVKQITKHVAQMDAEAAAQCAALLAQLKSVRDRLNARYEPAKARILQANSRSER